MKDETLQKVVKLIGSADTEELRVLSKVIMDRQQTIRNIEAAHNRRTLKVGDTVRLKNLRPKYLNGTLATITEYRGDKGFLVELNPRADRRAFQRFGGAPVIPANCLEAT